MTIAELLNEAEVNPVKPETTATMHPAMLIDTYVSIMEAAKKLHETAQAVLSGTCNGNAREYGEQVKMITKYAASIAEKAGKL